MRHSPTACAALALLWAAPALGSTERGAPPPLDWPRLAELRAILTDGAEPDDARARLERLGPEAAPAIWALSSGQALTDVDVSREQRAALLAALGDWSPRSVVEHLLGAVQPETTLDARLVMVDLLSATEHDAALPAVLEVLAAADPVQLGSHRVGRAVDASVARLLDGHPRRVQALLGALGDLPVPLLERVVRSVSQLRMSEATLVLTRAMSLARGLEPVVLEELSRRTCIVGDETRRECAALARGFLDDLEPKLRRHAAMAVGRLGDSASFEPLLGLLDDEDAGVRRVALLALQQLTGVQRSWPRARWSAWWSAESRWIDTASARHMQTLRHGTAFDARAALQELEEHPVFAFRLARLASNALQHADVHIRAAACETLARACAAHAIEHLIPALDDPHPVVRAAALAGLRQVTSTDQGNDARAWAAWWATVD